MIVIHSWLFSLVKGHPSPTSKPELMVKGRLFSTDLHTFQPSKSPAVIALGKGLIPCHTSFTAFSSLNPYACMQYTHNSVMTASLCEKAAKLLQEHDLSSQIDLVSGNSSATSSCAILGKSISLCLSLAIFQIGITCNEDYLR